MTVEEAYKRLGELIERGFKDAKLCGTGHYDVDDGNGHIDRMERPVEVIDFEAFDGIHDVAFVKMEGDV